MLLAGLIFTANLNHFEGMANCRSIFARFASIAAFRSRRWVWKWKICGRKSCADNCWLRHVSFLVVDACHKVHCLERERCEKLLIKAAQKGAHCVLSNAICLPFGDGCFDFVISIAVIHHLSTAHRRLEAVCQLLRCMSRDASGLIFVWAHEQTVK